ncbi:hypothetical protein niasHS_006409 [Heterodera schachtii]|uniref:Uncharacterized protein n=2 Tax=Heterodera TaxID=34509 RepID=A0ABD2JH96_HETSC
MRNPQQPRRRSLAANRVEPIQVAQQPRQPRYADITRRLDTLERTSERDRNACKEAAKELGSTQWNYFLFICGGFTFLFGGLGLLCAAFFYLNNRIDTLDSTLGSRIDSLGSTLGSRIDSLGSRIDTLVDHFSAGNCSVPTK